MNFEDAKLKFYHRWTETHRFYHGVEHLNSMLEKIDDNLVLKYFALFHDVIYDPRSSVNEERSAQLFRSVMGEIEDLTHDEKYLIIEMILTTKTHKTDSPIVQQAIDLDMDILKSDFPTLLDYEGKIFKEYQFHPIEEYRKGRVGFLRSQGLNQLADYVQNKKYNIGIYAGSFNPFHIGHLDVLRNAETIFDKVILVQGVNPDKGGEKVELPVSLPNEKIVHSGLITELFNIHGNYNLTMVRGMRNEFDVTAEMNYQAWVNELNPDIKFVHIFCRPENAKISSSGLKSMSSFKGFDINKYIVR